MSAPSADQTPGGRVAAFVTRRRGGKRWHVTDVLSWGYLALGVFLMFGPVLWLVLSSFKTQAALLEYPPTLTPLAQVQVDVDGYDKPLPLFDVAWDDGSVRQLAQVRRVGIESQMVDPAVPGERLRIPIDRLTKVREVDFAYENYTHPLAKLNFTAYLGNSVIVTVAATIITLIINSMAAYGLAIYKFPGRNVALGFVIGTLMFPITIILVPTYLIVTELGMVNSLWGVILPGAATPTGVFLLRQYMLTIPNELIEASRLDRASEWQIYWRIVMPLALPAVAVLTIFSVMWRWNEFLWPLIVLSKSEYFTLQIGLNSFAGEFNTRWNYLLAMTVVTLLPVVLVFGWLQRFITTGIASAGIK